MNNRLDCLPHDIFCKIVLYCPPDEIGKIFDAYSERFNYRNFILIRFFLNLHFGVPYEHPFPYEEFNSRRFTKMYLPTVPLINFKSDIIINKYEFITHTRHIVGLDKQIVLIYLLHIGGKLTVLAPVNDSLCEIYKDETDFVEIIPDRKNALEGDHFKFRRFDVPITFKTKNGTILRGYVSTRKTITKFVTLEPPRFNGFINNCVYYLKAPLKGTARVTYDGIPFDLSEEGNVHFFDHIYPGPFKSISCDCLNERPIARTFDDRIFDMNDQSIEYVSPDNKPLAMVFDYYTCFDTTIYVHMDGSYRHGEFTLPDDEVLVFFSTGQWNLSSLIVSRHRYPGIYRGDEKYFI